MADPEPPIPLRAPKPGRYDRLDYVQRLEIPPSDKGVYSFTYDESDPVHEQLVGDLAMDYFGLMPYELEDGTPVKIAVKGKRIVAFRYGDKKGGTISLLGGSRLHKKTRRSKGKRGYTKRR